MEIDKQSAGSEEHQTSIQVRIRLDPDVFSRLEKLAKVEHRNLGNMIAVMIERQLDAESYPKKASI